MSSSDSGEEVVDRAPPKKRVAKEEAAAPSAKKSKSKREVNADGSEMIDLGGKKFVTVREFKGKVLIDVREYYQKDGQWLPGKKGISMSKEQYNTLKSVLDEVDAKVAEM